MLDRARANFVGEPFRFALLILQLPNGRLIGVGAKLLRTDPAVSVLELANCHAQLRLGTGVSLKQIMRPRLEPAHTFHCAAEVARGGQQSLANIALPFGQLAPTFYQALVIQAEHLLE
jgi:hypothetical protein